MHSAIQVIGNLGSSRALGAAILFLAVAVPILSGRAGIAARPWRRMTLIAWALVGAVIAILANLGLISSLLLGGSIARVAGDLVSVILVTLIAVVIPFAVARLVLGRRGWVVYGGLALLFLDLLANASLLGWSISDLSVQTAVASIDVVAAVALPVVFVLRRSLKLDRLVIWLVASLPVAVYLMIGVSEAEGGGRI